MGGKQSTSGDVSVTQTPVTESIQDAYKAGDTSKAQELIRLSCEETALQVEKVGLGYCSLSDFIGKDAKISRCCCLLLFFSWRKSNWLCGTPQKHAQGLCLPLKTQIRMMRQTTGSSICRSTGCVRRGAAAVVTKTGKCIFSL